MPPWALQVQPPFPPRRGCDTPLAKAAALTPMGYCFAGLGFLAGLVKQNLGHSAPKGLRYEVPELPEVGVRSGCCPANASLALRLPHPCPILLYVTVKTKEPGRLLQTPRAISLRGHRGAAHRSEDSPLKPGAMTRWAQVSWFSFPT